MQPNLAANNVRRVGMLLDEYDRIQESDPRQADQILIRASMLLGDEVMTCNEELLADIDDRDESLENNARRMKWMAMGIPAAFVTGFLVAWGLK
jgi:hypothetical protein